MTDEQAIYLLSVEVQKRGGVGFVRPSTACLDSSQLRRLSRQGRVQRLRIPSSAGQPERDSYAPLAA